MRTVLVRCSDPVVRDPFFSFLYVTSTMQTILIPRPHPATPFIHEMIVPHDSCSFARTEHEVSLVAVVTEVIIIKVAATSGQLLFSKVWRVSKCAEYSQIRIALRISCISGRSLESRLPMATNRACVALNPYPIELLLHYFACNEK